MFPVRCDATTHVTRPILARVGVWKSTALTMSIAVTSIYPDSRMTRPQPIEPKDKPSDATAPLFVVGTQVGARLTGCGRKPPRPVLPMPPIASTASSTAQPRGLSTN